MPQKKHKGKKLSNAKQQKKAEAKKKSIARKQERAVKRKEFRQQANEAFNSWGGGLLGDVVRSCDTDLAKLHLGEWQDHKKDLVASHPSHMLGLARTIDGQMDHAIKSLASRKSIPVNQVVVGVVPVKPINENEVPLKDLIRWYSIAKKNALLVEQFHLHANKRNPHPRKESKKEYVDDRPTRTEAEQNWLTLQDKATKGIHIRGKARQPTAEKVAEAEAVVEKMRHDKIPSDNMPIRGDQQFTAQRQGLSRRTQYPTFNLI